MVGVPRLTDDFCDECVDMVDHGIHGVYVVCVLKRIVLFCGYPQAVRTNQVLNLTSPTSVVGAHFNSVGPVLNQSDKPPAQGLHRELQRQFRRRVPQRAPASEFWVGSL